MYPHLSHLTTLRTPHSHQTDDWPRHKRACRAAVAAEARRAKRRREATQKKSPMKMDNETCVICIEPVVAPVELPCGHAYCRECLDNLRKKGESPTCPRCRADLPPSLDGL